ncbi:NifU family protein [Candidatus Endowatersipora endosymbiont of Watersipora subatra]|uniref:NifU family protein n=1 Tax=Candidatus Endowatersipora endosymbiont of Watersipora subatra TaxID=3077946 RepID=UPI00312C79B5
MFIQTEATPNPATLKFLPGKTVSRNGPFEFTCAEDAAHRSALAETLFRIDNVTGVFFGFDFITVTKSDSIDWQNLKPAILGAIMEHFMTGIPVIYPQKEEFSDVETFVEEGSEEIVATIKELLETRVRPAVAQDGGDITFYGYKDGHVFLRMRGACAGCPSSTATLQHGIQNLLKHFIPEVERVEAVQ